LCLFRLGDKKVVGVFVRSCADSLFNLFCDLVYPAFYYQKLNKIVFLSIFNSGFIKLIVK
jgi:hypothetical protein